MVGENIDSKLWLRKCMDTFREGGIEYFSVAYPALVSYLIRDGWTDCRHLSLPDYSSLGHLLGMASRALRVIPKLLGGLPIFTGFGRGKCPLPLVNPRLYRMFEK